MDGLWLCLDKFVHMVSLLVCATMRFYLLLQQYFNGNDGALDSWPILIIGALQFFLQLFMQKCRDNL